MRSAGDSRGQGNRSQAKNRKRLNGLIGQKNHGEGLHDRICEISDYCFGRFLFRSPNEGRRSCKSSQAGSGLQPNEISWGL